MLMLERPKQTIYHAICWNVLRRIKITEYFITVLQNDSKLYVHVT